MVSVKSLFMAGILIGVYFAVAIVYVFWAIASFQWWLLIFAVLWAGLGLLNVRTAKKKFETVQGELDLARVDGMISAYENMGKHYEGVYSAPDNGDEAEKS